MTLQPSQQATEMHILPNISRSKDNEAMKVGQVIEDNTRKFSLNIMQKISQRNYLQTSLVYIKDLHEVKASGLELIFNTFL